MNAHRMFPLLLVVLVAALAAPPFLTGTLDDGRLDATWFGDPGLVFRETDSVDYLYVKPGFRCEGRTFWVKPWQAPAWKGETPDVADEVKAEELTQKAQGRVKAALSEALRGKAKASPYAGDVLVEGRYADVRVGGKVAGFAASATWDLRFTDKTTGVLLVAVHHRSINGTFLTEIQGRIDKWLDQFGAALRYDLREYGKGKPRTS